jgi:hypothetical protein
MASYHHDSGTVSMDGQRAARAYLQRLILLIGLALGTGADRAEAQPPLAGLPSAPGKHIEQIKALADNTWLNLGSPAADPKWGKGRGRAWSSRMPYAPDLRAAFLFGEGIHAWWNKKNNRYMDDLFVYDVMAHRWICAHPGTEVTTVNLKLDQNRFEVDEDERPVPVAQLSHGYEQLTYDTDRHRFLFWPGSSQDWQSCPFGKRRLAWGVTGAPERRQSVAVRREDRPLGLAEGCRAGAGTQSHAVGDDARLCPVHEKSLFLVPSSARGLAL